MKKVHLSLALALLSSCLLAALPAFGQEEAPAAEPQPTYASKPEMRPWAMRDSYSFRMGNLRLYFFTDNAEMYVATLDERVWLESSDFEIVFRNGEVIRGKDLDGPFVDRVPFEGVLGEGLNFQAIFPAKNGLAITFRVARFKNLGFLLVEILVKNERAEAVEIEKIRSIVIEPGTLKRLGPGTNSETKIINTWDDVTLFDAEKAPALILLKDYSEDAHLGLAMLPKGLGEPLVSITAQDDGWHGEITTIFPPVPLQPGETLTTNPALISIGVADTASLEETFAWGLSQMPGAAQKRTGRAASTRPSEHGESNAPAKMPASAAADAQGNPTSDAAAEANAAASDAPLATEADADPGTDGQDKPGFFKRSVKKMKGAF
jgi:hypothetical protein